MASLSTFDQAKELSNQLTSILASTDAEGLPMEQRTLVASINQLAEHMRLTVRDYDFAETRAEQQQSSLVAKLQLEKLQAAIVKASEYDLFGPVDVAQISACLQKIISDLQ